MPEWFDQPPWFVAVGFVAVGFWAMMKGADLLVEGGVVIAKRYQLSMAVIGATIVAFGTSLPELVVSVGSVLMGAAELAAEQDAGLLSVRPSADGEAAIAIANIVGSNIFNIGAILGSAALLTPLAISRSTKRLDFPLMLLVFGVFVVFCLPFDGSETGTITRPEALVLVVGLIAFTVFAIKFGKVDPDEVPDADASQGMLKASAWIVLGILLLTAGGKLALNGGVALAATFGMSERLIGLTVMAVGTSLPELLTSIQAARKGHADLAVANVVGSNLFNVLCIVGISGLVLPLPVPAAVVSWDFLWMAGFAVLLAPFIYSRRGLKRGGGALLLAGLIAFVVTTLLFTNRQPGTEAPTSASPASLSSQSMPAD